MKQLPASVSSADQHLDAFVILAELFYPLYVALLPDSIYSSQGGNGMQKSNVDIPTWLDCC